MKKPKIYIAGPITDMPNHNIEDFLIHQELCNNYGFEAIDPHQLFEGVDTSNYTHTDFMRTCIKAMMDCQLLVTLTGWEKSEGANIEVELARKLGIEVKSHILLQNWLKEKKERYENNNKTC